MPQRFLRPGITNSQRWNAVEPQSANLFIRLLTLVDDFGRTDGRVSVVLGHCFSVWNECHPKQAVKLLQVAGMLQQLMSVELIDVYDIEGKRVLQITQWQERIREGCKSKWPERTEVAASCSELLPPPPSPSPTPSPVHQRHSTNGSQEPHVPTDAEWLKSLEGSEAYKGINVRREYAKMLEWCRLPKNKRKPPSRSRFINWLNKCDIPLRTSEPDLDKSKIDVPPQFKKWATVKYAQRADDITKWRTWADVPDYMRSEWWREAKSEVTSGLL